LLGLEDFDPATEAGFLSGMLSCSVGRQIIEAKGRVFGADTQCIVAKGWVFLY